MRHAFVETFIKLVKHDCNVCLLTADLGFMTMEPIYKAYPNNVMNVGVAEANMIGLAYGMSKCNRRVFVYSLIPFVTMRCLEQIRVCLCMTKANVTIVGVGGGYSYGNQGSSHHSIEDIGIMTSLPNMKVFVPCDPWEVERGMKELINIQGPSYIRIEKTGEPVLHNAKDKFNIGKWNYLRRGKGVTIIACGGITHTCLQVADYLEADGISASVVSAHTLKPIDLATLQRIASENQFIFTVERHAIWGGLGSIIGASLARLGATPKIFYSFAMQDGYHSIAGSMAYLEEMDGLSAESIRRKIVACCREN